MDLTPYEDMMSWLKKQIGEEVYDVSQVLENAAFMNLCVKHLNRIGVDVKAYTKQFGLDLAWCLKFKRDGEKIFCVGRNLVEALSNTSCEADVALVKFPYNTFMIQVPEGSLGGVEYLQMMKAEGQLVVLFKDFGTGCFLPGLKSRHQGYYDLDMPESGIWKEPKDSIPIDTRPERIEEPGVYASPILIELHRFVSISFFT